MTTTTTAKQDRVRATAAMRRQEWWRIMEDISVAMGAGDPRWLICIEPNRTDGGACDRQLVIDGWKCSLSHTVAGKIQRLGKNMEGCERGEAAILNALSGVVWLKDEDIATTLLTGAPRWHVMVSVRHHLADGAMRALSTIVDLYDPGMLAPMEAALCAAILQPART